MKISTSKSQLPTICYFIFHLIIFKVVINCDTLISQVPDKTEKSLFYSSFFSKDSRDPIDPVNGVPIAFGDFDSDHRVDIFLLTDGGKSIQALKGEDCVGKCRNF